MMQADGEVRLSPPWRHALAVLISQGVENGKVIRKAELVELFGLRNPVTAEDQERFQMDFLQQFSELRDELLEEHRVALRTMYGEASYEVVPPAHQTDLAMREGMRDLRRSMRKMTRTLAFVRHEELTDEQRKQNADAQAKAAMMAGMIRKPQLPPPTRDA
ncbi:MAG: hypothetical protein ACTS5G_01210 [Burkholderiales bacterium]